MVKASGDSEQRPSHASRANHVTPVHDHDHSAEREQLVQSLSLALAAADLGTWDWEPKKDELTVSERTAEIYGIPVGTHNREKLRELLHPDHRQRARSEAARALAERRDYDIEYPLVSGKWIAARGRGLYGPSGELIRMFGVSADITARKEAELALRESETRHRVLADLAAVTQALTDPTQIMAASARVLAEHLEVDRCAYAEIEDEATYVITGDYAVGVNSIVGRWSVAAFGAEHQRLMRAGEPYVVDDADLDPRVTAEDLVAYRAAEIRALICVPLLKDGRFTAAMAVHQTVPRRWMSACRA